MHFFFNSQVTFHMIDDVINQNMVSDQSERDQEFVNNRCSLKVIKNNNNKKSEQIDQHMGSSCALPLIWAVIMSLDGAARSRWLLQRGAGEKQRSAFRRLSAPPTHDHRPLQPLRVSVNSRGESVLFRRKQTLSKRYTLYSHHVSLKARGSSLARTGARDR